MSRDPAYWLAAGAADRAAGNDRPAVTREDFFREIEDERVARECAAAYERGWRS